MICMTKSQPRGGRGGEDSQLRYSPREIARTKLVIADTAFLLDDSVILAVVESVSLEELRTGETPQHL